MLKLILGTAGSGKTARITNEIRERTARREGGIFFIVPEQYSHEAERELCAVCGDSLSLYAEVLSFSRLAVRVSQEMGTGGKISLDKGGRLLCMSLALSQIGSRLALYSAARHRAELQASLLQAVGELKTACIGADDLYKASASAGAGLAEKLCDLALCLEAYDAILAQGHADPADKLLRLSETIGESSIGRGGHIYIDGFTDFTGAEMRVITALLRKNADISICLTCDGTDGDSEHFEPARRAAHALLRLASEQGADAEIINLKEPLIKSPARPDGDFSVRTSTKTLEIRQYSCEFLARRTENSLANPCDGFNQRFLDTKSDKAAPLVFFEEKLYSYTSEVRENENGCIRLVCADNARAECEMAAAHCLKLARETGCRWRDFAIAVRGFDEYAPILTEVFARYGVPLFTARQESILQKPAPALISSAFEIIFGGWDTDAVLGYLKTGLLPLSQEESDLLEGYILMWHPRSSMWGKKGAWTQHPQGFGKEFDDESTALLGKIDELRRRLAAPLLALFAAGKRAQTAAEQAAALADFLVAINLPQTLSERAVELDNAGRELLAAEYVQLWEIILKSLEQFAAILGEAPMTQELFSKLYLQTLSQYEVSVIPVSADSVSAGDMDRMRRRHIKHLIVLGAGDDRLPRIQDAGGIFSSDERDTLSEIGLPLGGGTDDLSRELSLIYNCVTLPSQTLTLSYCAFDSSGAEVRPSFLINRARLLFNLEAERFDPQAARLSAPRPAFMLAANAFSGGEKNARLAFEYFSETEKGREKLFSLRDRAGIKRGELSKPAVMALYGDTLRLSPSRADSFSSCRFSYFLRYGLKLNEREQAGFEAPELGSFMHYVLENVAGEISAGAGFKAASPEISNALTDKYTERYIAEVLHGFEDKSPRFVYLFNRLRPSVRNIVADMVSELAASDFAPLDFELSFMHDGDLPPVRLSDGENEILLNGIADRVDGYMKDGKLYLRVIDYKTGKKSFSLSDIWYGMGMQMLLYLFALEREGSARYNCEIVPAGVLYVPARDALISAPGDLSDEELAAEKAKLHRRSGLILNNSDIITAMEHGDAPEYIPVKYKKDGSANEDSLANAEQLKLLSEHLDRRLLELAEKLSGGCIDATPIYRGEQENACLFCPYGSVCRFDDTRDKRCYLSKIKPAEFWSRLEDEK